MAEDQDEGPGMLVGNESDPVEAAPKAKKAPAKKVAAKGMPDREWIILEENSDIPPTGLYVGHNGTGYLIRCGEPVSVPKFLLEVLDHAVMTSAVIDPTTQRIIGHRDRMRFPYRRVAAPADAE